MIAVRYNFNSNTRYKELAEAIKSHTEYGIPKPPHGWRIYQGHTLGSWHMVIWELEFESLAEYEAWLEEFISAPRFREWLDLRQSFTERGTFGEVWRVEQFE